MTDKELLELAARAAGITGFWVDAGLNIGTDAAPVIWNPLVDDGDALRLAVYMGLQIEVDNCYDETRISECGQDLLLKHLHFDGGPEAATRRAIVRAAAAIGITMKPSA